MRVFSILILLAQLEIVARLVLVNVYIQVGLLNEARSGFGSFQVEYKRVLGHGELDSVAQRSLLRLERNHISHQCILEKIHVSLLIFCKLLDEPLERFPCFSLGGAGPTTEELRDTVLQNLIYEVLVSECLLLFGVLPNYAHDLTQAIRVIYRHFYSGQRLRFVQEQVDMSSHLLLFLALHRHDLNFL